MVYDNKGGASNALKYFNDQDASALERFQKGGPKKGGSRNVDVNEKKNKIVITTTTVSDPDSEGTQKVSIVKDKVRKRSVKGSKKTKTFRINKKS